MSGFALYCRLAESASLVFCSLIRFLRLESNPASCDKKSHSEHLTSVEGLGMKDSLRVHMLNHLENYLAQRELAINAAVVASAQMGLPKPTLFLARVRGSAWG